MAADCTLKQHAYIQDQESLLTQPISCSYDMALLLQSRTPKISWEGIQIDVLHITHFWNVSLLISQNKSHKKSAAKVLMYV
mmetsp:Transcript_148583/g.259689  ORF Transcript_148583/g.259689 Transcript_148583/m.259689 type:complete len:81 (-) Transcript_148583:372-614(-)